MSNNHSESSVYRRVIRFHFMTESYKTGGKERPGRKKPPTMYLKCYSTRFDLFSQSVWSSSISKTAWTSCSNQSASRTKNIRLLTFAMQNSATTQNCVQPTPRAVNLDQICGVINCRTVINLLSASLAMANAGKNSQMTLICYQGTPFSIRPLDRPSHTQERTAKQAPRAAAGVN